jgi:O-acetyl-ADP-ribose deacetylase (regulator of RNase III)
MEFKMMQSVLRVVLVDINPRVVDAWRSVFANHPEVEIVRGSILHQEVDAWVTPTNALGNMDGGVDAAIKRHLGPGIEHRVQREIGQHHQGMLMVGHATCVPSGVNIPRFVISTPTMVMSAEDISGTMNVALACAAAFQAIHMQNEREPDSIISVAMPGLGAATGCVPARTCAKLMWAGYTLFKEGTFRDFNAMRAALQSHLGEPAPMHEEVAIQIKVPGDHSDKVAPWLWQ